MTRGMDKDMFAKRGNMGNWLILGIFLSLMLTGTARAETVIMMDLDTGYQFDVTAAMRFTANIGTISGVTALSLGNGPGDDWLLITGDDKLQFLDSATFQPLFSISQTALRDVFGLPAGDGVCSALKKAGSTSDTLIYYDIGTAEWFGIDLKTGETGRFTHYELSEPFYAGFGFTSTTDDGMIVRSTTDNWWYESLPDRWTVDLDMMDLFEAIPIHFSEFKYSSGEAVMHFIMAVVDGSSPGTPTPTPGPGTPTATPTPGGNSNYDVVVAMGLGETLWRIDAETYASQSNLALTGQAPNRIVQHGNELFVINSLSHSITVYDAVSLAMKREMSAGIGSSPFDMAFVDGSTFYVTQFNTNQVSRYDAASGALVAVIEMPNDLPSDPGKTTAARPSGIVRAGDVAFVACANLDTSYFAGGPGVVVAIDIASNQVTGWFESSGRNCTNVAHNPDFPDWLWTVNAGDYSSQGFEQNGTISVFNRMSFDLIETLQTGDAPLELVFGSQRAYYASAADGRVGRVHSGNLTLLPPVTLPTAGQGLNLVSGLAVGPDERLWVLEFNHDKGYVLDTTQNDEIIHQLELGSGPDALVVVER